RTVADWEAETRRPPPPAATDDEADHWPLHLTEARARYRDVFTAPVWIEADGDRLRWVRTEAAAGTAAFLDALFRSEDGVTGEELARAAGVPARSVPPLLRSAADLCRRVGRRAVWEASRSGGVWHYRVPDAIRHLLAAGDP